ncbi:MAG: hypothetical protein JL50_04105 [Peptococcaceae bacterium BICA1-7]|nr:MAG: hypothetical protein JL50_04105 [Peptococcaceae bacterium BICA1-7]HBV97553.1 hypothetical protein [Desulfotomaculum sp.]
MAIVDGQPTNGEKVLNWQREEKIAIPLTEREKRMAIRCSDWNRIMRNVKNNLEPTPKISIIYSILFGIAGSAGLSIIPIAKSEGLASWVAPLYVCTFIFSLLCAFVFLLVEIKIVQPSKCSRIKEIEDDMKDIEDMFIVENNDTGPKYMTY